MVQYYLPLVTGLKGISSKSANNHWNPYESRHEKNSSGIPTRLDTNRAVEPQKMATGLKFGIEEVEGLFYFCSKNKGADQLFS